MMALCSFLAAITLGSPFTDGAVLQRGKPVPVWGWSSPCEQVVVDFAGQKVRATADAKGKWRVILSPLSAVKKPRELFVSSVTNRSDYVRVKDVLVGEVFICAGQSNMEFPLCGGHPHFSDRLGATVAQTLNLQNVRYVRVPYLEEWRSGVPRERTRRVMEWRPFTAWYLMRRATFSAVGAYFALEIYHALECQVPVGIIGCYDGGTCINAWTPQFGETPHAETSCLNPGVLFNEMVAPCCPYALRGMLWYQGCYDAPAHDTYAAKMHRLYDGWVKSFEQPGMPIYFVQLAPWWSTAIPYIQEAQAQFARNETNAFMAVTCDIGNTEDIHPYEKLTVAKRLALHALKRDFGFKGIEAESPVLKSWKIDGAVFLLSFDHAKKLHVYNEDMSNASGFEIAGADGKFVPAVITNMIAGIGPRKNTIYRGNLTGEGLAVRAPGVTAPRKLRYLYRKPWHGNVYNEVNLPLAAFHIDADLCEAIVGDGGFATVSAALEHVREQRRSGGIYAGKKAVIRVRPGVHPLGSTLRLGPKDSNLAFVGTDGKSVLSGGVELKGFKVGKDGIWRLKLDKNLSFDQLWVNGVRAPRARSPNKGYFYIRGSVLEGPDPDNPSRTVDLSRRSLEAFPADVKGYANLPLDELTNVVAVAYYGWDTDWMRIRKVDAGTGRVTLLDNHGRDFFMWPEYMNRYTVENFRAALDVPGEWFLDRKAGELLYIPRPGETTEATVAVAAVLDRLAEVRGSAKDGYPSNVSFTGISFEHAGWRMPAACFTRQAAYNVDAAVELAGVRGFSFVRCSFKHTAAHGLWVKEDCQSGKISTCLFDDIGGGGVWIGGRKKPPEEPLTSNINICNCIVTRTGKVFPEGTGIALTHVSDCWVQNNEISDTGYIGVSLGYTWSYIPTSNRRIHILENHIHHLGRATTSDMGGIYLLGINTGTKIEGNFVHDVYSYDYTGCGGEGLYGDMGTSGVFWRSNLVYRTRGSSVNINFGMDNKFIGNVFALPGSFNPRHEEPFFKHWKVENNVTAVFSNNVCYAAEPNTAKVVCKGYGGAPGPNVHHGGNVLCDASGVWTNTVAQSIRKKAGVHGDAAWCALAWRIGNEARNPDPPMEPPRYNGMKRLHTGFESVETGATLPSLFKFSGHGGKELVKGTDKIARHGRRSMEISDRKGLKPSYLPHFFVEPSPAPTSGTFRVAFSIRCTDKAKVSCALRDYNPKAKNGSGVAMGPHVDFVGGKVSAGDKEAMTLAPETWCDCELVCRFTPSGRIVADARFTDANGRTTEVKNVPYADSAFSKVSWIGFTSDANEDCTWWLDDFSCIRE